MCTDNDCSVKRALGVVCTGTHSCRDRGDLLCLGRLCRKITRLTVCGIN